MSNSQNWSKSNPKLLRLDPTFVWLRWKEHCGIWEQITKSENINGRYSKEHAWKSCHKRFSWFFTPKKKSDLNIFVNVEFEMKIIIFWKISNFWHRKRKLCTKQIKVYRGNEARLEPNRLFNSKPYSKLIKYCSSKGMKFCQWPLTITFITPLRKIHLLAQTLNWIKLNFCSS